MSAAQEIPVEPTESLVQPPIDPPPNGIVNLSVPGISAGEHPAFYVPKLWADHF
jgi:hypothetical protein